MAEENKHPKVLAKQAKEVRLPTAAYGLALSDDDNLCHVTGMDGGVHAVEIQSGKTKRIGGHDSYAASLERLPGSQTLISAGTMAASSGTTWPSARLYATSRLTIFGAGR